MSAGAFTPGPWECRRALHPDNTGGFDYAIAADGKIIAEAFEHVDYADGRDGYDCRPVAANARLIAAAPELFSEAEKLLAAWDESRERALRGPSDLIAHSIQPDRKTDAQLQQEAREALDGLRAALARARGEA